QARERRTYRVAAAQCEQCRSFPQSPQVTAPSNQEARRASFAAHALAKDRNVPSRATLCADHSALLVRVRDVLIQTTTKAHFCKAHAALLGRAPSGCLRRIYAQARLDTVPKRVRPDLGGDPAARDPVWGR